MGKVLTRQMRYAGALCACWLLMHGTGRMAAQEDGQANEASGAPGASSDHKFVELAHIPAAEMAPRDQSLVNQKAKEIAREADFFGYDLSAGKWSYDQVLCPDMPDSLILHYRSQARDGAESIFTAVVPRGTGRVFVVPVLFRNAIPFHAAAGSERSMTVFNQAVPAEIAHEAAQDKGRWLQLGMCYAAVAGAEPQVPERADTETALVRAPVPTLRISADNRSREIIFSDRNSPEQYMVWDVTMNDQGRVIAASARSFADYQTRVANGANPPERVIRPQSEPPEKVIQPGAPQEKTIPPGTTPKETHVPQTAEPQSTTVPQ